MKYRTIVADPPWHYDSLPSTRPPKHLVEAEIDRHRRKKTPYLTMSVDEISALPVRTLAENGCHLYLWMTNRYLPDAFEIAKAWGFRYSQLLVWAKTPMGIGPGGAFAQNAEYILFARRGSLAHRQRLDTVWFTWPRTAVHSKKPEHFLDLVESVSPGPYVELFSRRHRMGWDVWGNESANTATLEPAS